MLSLGCLRKGRSEAALRHEQNACAKKIRPVVARIQNLCPNCAAVPGTVCTQGKLFSPLFLSSWAKCDVGRATPCIALICSGLPAPVQ